MFQTSHNTLWYKHHRERHVDRKRSIIPAEICPFAFGFISVTGMARDPLKYNLHLWFIDSFLDLRITHFDQISF